MHIAVYLAAVPAKTKNQSKRELLLAFAQGAQQAGETVTLVDRFDQVIDCDLAVLQGWIGMKQAPHLDLRQRVIKNQLKNNQHVLIIDSNLFGFLDPVNKDRYLRYSIGGIFPSSGYYFDLHPDPARWIEISNSYGFKEKSWQTNGSNILICLQRQGGWSMAGFSVIDWLDDIIPKITKLSDRQIIIRPHPGNIKFVPEVRRRWPQIKISEIQDIRDDLSRSWCTVTYNSSPGVASLLWGVPTFVTDPDPRRSQAWPEANLDLSCIESPKKPDRQSLYQRLSQCHFATADLSSGRPWQFMRDRLP